MHVLTLSYHLKNHMNKKQLRKEIEAKLDTTFGHLAKEADKKFRKIIKKASHLLTDVLHQTEAKPKKVKKAITVPVTKKLTKTVVKATEPAPKKKAVKKAVKKVAAKKK